MYQVVYQVKMTFSGIFMDFLEINIEGPSSIVEV